MISRRSFIPTLAAGALSAAGAVRRNVRRPNIILILADDLGYGDLSCYGHPTIRTPNLDNLASRGMRFTNWYSAAPVCTPSRAALMTGRYPVRTGLTNVLAPGSLNGLPAAELTMAQLLKSAGYRTSIVGKWHLGDQAQFLPSQRGFDSTFTLPYSNDMTSSPVPGVQSTVPYPPLPLIRDGKTVELNPDQTLLTRRFTEEARRTIETSSTQPFFLYFAHTAPHVPLYASPEFRGRSVRGPYGDVVEEMDWSVGEVMRSLEETGQLNNTLVIFTSDNGPWEAQKQHGGSAGLLKGGKSSISEGGMREPCIVWCPGLVPAGAVNGSVCSTMDLFPTFACLAEASLPKNLLLDGRDITRILAGGSSSNTRPFYYWNTDELRGVRRGAWKLRTSPGFPASGPEPALGAPLLYNLDEDPAEEYDLASEHPALVQELLSLMRTHAATVPRGAPSI